MTVIAVIAFLAVGYLALVLSAADYGYGIAFIGGLLAVLLVILIDVRWDVQDIKKMLSEKKDKKEESKNE